MRQNKYVDDVLECMNLAKLENAEEIWNKLNI
jgi:hypothetical protein